MPTRRSVLRGGVFGAAGLAMPAAATHVAAKDAGASMATPAYLIPGYAPDEAYLAGRPLRESAEAARALGQDHEGPVTLLTRLGADGGETRALMPVRGHDVEVAPDRRHAVFVGMDHPAMVRIDTETLDVTHRAVPHADGYVFGGHAVYSADGATVFVAERRADDTPFAGEPDRYHGRISVRDAATLRVLDSFSAYGIGPHEIVALDGGRHLAIANYGRVPWPADQAPPAPRIPYGVEPSLTVIDAADGRLLHKAVSARPQHELRHIAGAADRLFGVQARLDTFDNVQRVLRGRNEIYEPDVSDPARRGYLPVPVLRFDVEGAEVGQGRGMTDNPLLMQRGQSIAYDPVHDEALAVFTSAHTVVAFDGATGAAKRVVRTDRLGLRLPRGIALLPDGTHYAVSGHRADVYVFSRGRHELRRDACRYAPLFGHSHLAIA